MDVNGVIYNCQLLLNKECDYPSPTAEDAGGMSQKSQLILMNPMLKAWDFSIYGQ